MNHLNELRLLGRAAVDAEGTLWLASSAAEAAFLLRDATFLRFVLRCDDTCTDPNRQNIRPRCAVDLDGVRVLDAQLRPASEALLPGEETWTVFEGVPARTAAVRFVKLSECTQSILGIRAIETDGSLSPVPGRARKIEFIGDSITCGYGVEGDETQVFQTATENAEKAWAVLTARALDADAMLTCFSGHGLLSGYTEGERNDRELVQPYYERVGSNSFVLPGGRRLQDIPWDFSRFRPDTVVIHLGTNDASWVRGQPERRAQFRERYAAFLPVVRRNNPQARILCILGTLTEDLNEDMLQAVAEYIRTSGDGRIRACAVPLQDRERDGIGTDGHPSPATQRRLADRVTELLRGWEAGAEPNA